MKGINNRRVHSVDTYIDFDSSKDLIQMTLEKEIYIQKQYIMIRSN